MATYNPPTHFTPIFSSNEFVVDNGITEAELTSKLAKKLDYPTAQGQENFSSIGFPAYSIPSLLQTNPYKPLILQSDAVGTSNWTWTLSQTTLNTPFFANMSNFLWTTGVVGGTQTLAYGQVSQGGQLLTPSILGISAMGYATKENITFNIPNSPTYNAYGYSMGQTKAYNSTQTQTLSTINYNNGSDWYIVISSITSDINVPSAYATLWILPSF
jgi:hypothetical protein